MPEARLETYCTDVSQFTRLGSVTLERPKNWCFGLVSEVVGAPIPARMEIPLGGELRAAGGCGAGVDPPERLDQAVAFAKRGTLAGLFEIFVMGDESGHIGNE